MKRPGLLSLCALLFAAAGCHMDFERVPAEMTSLTDARPLEAEKSLKATVRFDIGSLEISSEQSGNIYSLDLEYDKASYQPSVRYTASQGGTEGELDLGLEAGPKPRIRTEGKTNRLRLNLTEAVPVSLRINTGVGDARLSLSNLQLTGLDIESGVGGAKVSAYEPNRAVCDRIRIRNGVGSMEAIGLGNLNFRELDFEGGVGGASLDFSGDWTQDADIRIQVGVGGVTLKMPRDVGVRVDAEKHFLSGVHLEGFTQRDSLYYSSGYDTARVRVSIRVATGIGGFRINWI